MPIPPGPVEQEMLKRQGEGQGPISQSIDMLANMPVFSVGMAAEKAAPKAVKLTYDNMAPYIEKHMLDTPVLKDVLDNMLKLANDARDVGPQSLRRRAAAIVHGMGYPNMLWHEHDFLKGETLDKVGQKAFDDVKGAMKWGRDLYERAVWIPVPKK